MGARGCQTTGDSEYAGPVHAAVEQVQGSGGALTRWLVCAGFIIAAAALRLDQLTLMEFKADEAMFHRGAIDIVEHGRWPLVGQRTSHDTRKPPVTHYMLALPAVIDPDPLVMAGFVALLDALAVGVIFLVGARVWDLRTGTIAAAWFLASPWAVLYARKIWNPGLVIFTSTLALAGMLALRRRPGAIGWSLATPLLVLVTWELHDAGTPLIVIGVVALAYDRRALHPGACAAGVALAALLLVPYVGYERQVGWRDLLRTADVAFEDRAHTPLLSLTPVRYTADILGAGGFDFLFGESLPELRAAGGAATAATLSLQPLVALLLIGGWVALIVGVARTATWSPRPPWLGWAPARGADVLLIVWLGVPWALFMIAGLRNWHHYFVPCYPAAFLILARVLVGVADWGRHHPPSLRRTLLVAGVTVIACGVPLAWLGFDRQLNAYLSATGGARGDYGITYAAKRAAVERAMQHGLALQHMPPEYADLYSYLAMHGVRYAAAVGRYALFEYAPDRAPACAGNVDVGPVRLCPLE
jgi:hypothetical protein